MIFARETCKYQEIFCFIVDTTWIVNRREGKHVYYDQKNRWAYMIITRYNEKGDAIEIINYRSD